MGCVLCNIVVVICLIDRSPGGADAGGGADDELKPRSVHALTADVLSSEEPDVLLVALRRAVTASQWRCETVGSKYMLLCSQGDSKGNFVQWEAEVCRLPLRSTNAIRYKKVTGTSAQFKAVMTRLSTELNI